MRFELTDEAVRRRKRHKLMPVRALQLGKDGSCASEELAPDGRLVRNRWACIEACMETLALGWQDFDPSDEGRMRLGGQRTG